MTRPAHGRSSPPRTLPQRRTERATVRLAWIAMAGLMGVLLAMSPAGAQPAQPNAAPGAATLPPPPAATAVGEPDGYRMDNYRAPTPATLRGARVIGTDQAETLWREKKAVFVDVMPRDVRPANLPPGTIWRDKKRDDIPGSVWLPNVGYGALNAQMDAYFRNALAAAVDGRKDAPVVFYCQTDCWMSWNAARRAIEEYGYTSVIWYPGGSDGWARANLPLVPALPVE